MSILTQIRGVWCGCPPEVSTVPPQSGSGSGGEAEASDDHADRENVKLEVSEVQPECLRRVGIMVSQD